MLAGAVRAAREIVRWFISRSRKNMAILSSGRRWLRTRGYTSTATGPLALAQNGDNFSPSREASHKIFIPECLLRFRCSSVAPALEHSPRLSRKAIWLFAASDEFIGLCWIFPRHCQWRRTPASDTLPFAEHRPLASRGSRDSRTTELESPVSPVDQPAFVHQGGSAPRADRREPCGISSRHLIEHRAGRIGAFAPSAVFDLSSSPTASISKPAANPRADRHRGILFYRDKLRDAGRSSLPITQCLGLNRS